VWEEGSREASPYPDWFEVFLVFSKLDAPFTEEEIKWCRAAQDPYRQRVILLSARELESDISIYEQTAKEFQIDRIAISLDDLAQATPSIYLNPKPRSEASASK
jgi:hypothetical protein